MSFSIMLYMLFCVTPLASAGLDESGSWNEAELSQIIASARRHDTPGAQIVSLSNHFLDTPYAANTLVGGPQKPEQLVVSLTEFDCFTFLDVIEALRRTSKVENFPEQLKNVRYFDGTVTYESRRHFFSNWIVGDAAMVQDVTVAVGQGRAQAVKKQLNRKADGSLWLPEVAVIPQQLYYIPTETIDTDVLSALKSGDYVGVYSHHAGLDVSHTGLIVKGGGDVMLRHASSRQGVNKVVDEDLFDYLQGKPGLLVYRVKP